jgi:hypothetical protein
MYLPQQIKRQVKGLYQREVRSFRAVQAWFWGVLCFDALLAVSLSYSVICWYSAKSLVRQDQYLTVFGIEAGRASGTVVRRPIVTTHGYAKIFTYLILTCAFHLNRNQL